MTDAERRLWREIRRDSLGVRFRRQLVFDQRYIIDFYAPSIRLAVEVDGGQHAARTQEDRVRTAHLTHRGVNMLRFWNNQVLQENEAVVHSIAEVVEYLQTHLPLTPSRSAGGKRPAADSPLSPPGARGVGAEDFGHLRLTFAEQIA